MIDQSGLGSSLCDKVDTCGVQRTSCVCLDERIFTIIHVVIR